MFSSGKVLSRGYATLELAVSVCRSVGHKIVLRHFLLLPTQPRLVNMVIISGDVHILYLFGGVSVWSDKINGVHKASNKSENLFHLDEITIIPTQVLT